mmetsp:Transcript_21141/g.39046  ORF Transcript_21141/g.39046 Transcript_21141/m.39046 type:complete len:156 (-) Transcript_21141:84-551(-)
MLWSLILLVVAAQSGLDRRLKGCLAESEVFNLLKDLFGELNQSQAETLALRFMQHIDTPTISELEGWIRNFDLVEFAEQLTTSEASLIASHLKISLPDAILAEPSKYGFTRETREALTLNFNHKLELLENSLAVKAEEEVIESSAPRLSTFVFGN